MQKKTKKRKGTAIEEGWNERRQKKVDEVKRKGDERYEWEGGEER